MQPNATMTCMTCKQQFDKGCPPIDGQDDSTFVCEGCSDKYNAKMLAAQTPTMVIDGNAK